MYLSDHDGFNMQIPKAPSCCRPGLDEDARQLRRLNSLNSP